MPVARRPSAQLLVESVLGAQGDLPEEQAALGHREVVEAAYLHRVRPAIRRRLASAPNAPAAWRPALEHARHSQLLRHMKTSADLRLVGEALVDAGTRWAVSKGPVLADGIWPSPDMREYTDVDLFVHPSDFAEALDRLEGAGFDLVDRNWPELLRQQRAELALTGPSGMALDLHWDVVVPRRDRGLFRSDLPAMLARRRTVVLGSGVTVPAFDATDTLLHVAFHAARSGANRLVWLGDVLFAAQAPGVDWTELELRARRSGMTAPVAMVLARTERTLDVTFPLPPRMRRHADQTLWARAARRGDAHGTFPGLPGDASLGGALYTSARGNAVASACSALVTGVSVRRIEAAERRHPARANPLDRDVPDRRARAAYLASVGAGAGAGAGVA